MMPDEGEGRDLLEDEPPSRIRSPVCLLAYHYRPDVTRCRGSPQGLVQQDNKGLTVSDEGRVYPITV